MIYRAAVQEEDKKRLTGRCPDCSVKEPDRDFTDVIVKKPWGYEYLVLQNESVAVWMLQVVRKRKTSMHCHPLKKTSLVLLSGKARFSTFEGTRDLVVGDGVVIEPGVFHSTEAENLLAISPQSENGIWVMEIETPPQKNDLVRLEDAYGRQGQSYEGADHMVEGPQARLQLRSVSGGDNVEKKFLEYVFRRQNGLAGQDLSGKSGLICAIACAGDGAAAGSTIPLGEIFTLDDFWKTYATDVSRDTYTYLVMEKQMKMMRVADYIFQSLARLGVKQVFAVSGGGAMHLVDAVGKNPDLEYIATHHEQAAAMAAEGYARMTTHPGAALVTSGPGGTNALTGVCGAWIDSIPTVFVSGQVTMNTLLEGTGVRQFGIQESDIVSLMCSVTKYAVTVKKADSIRCEMEKAVYLATSGRPGPVWLDIPLDIQSQLVDENEMEGFIPPVERSVFADPAALDEALRRCREMLMQARRPVMIIGYGIRLAHAEKEIMRLIALLGIPVVSSWTASDLIPTDDERYVGRSGIMGDRAGNFAVQNADLLLVIGSRLSIPQVGYNYRLFAREAKKIMVDIDEQEMKKPSLSIDLPVLMDAGVFIREFLARLDVCPFTVDIREWQERCQGWKQKYPVALPEYAHNTDKINSFYFVDVLSKRLGPEAIVVTDMGTSFTCTMQTFHVTKGQRLFTSSGHASMGFGLPGAIGACFGSGRKKVICVSGDGGLQMNIQELQTMVHCRLPIILFVLNNNGYLTIKHMQQNHFGQYVGSDPSSGVSTPDMAKIAAAYGIGFTKFEDQKALDGGLDQVLAQAGPYICEIMMPEDQPLIPRISSFKKPDGTVTARPMEDLYPFLDRKEFMSNMIVKPVEPLKS